MTRFNLTPKPLSAGYAAELAFAKQLARDAGAIMTRYFRLTPAEWKTDNTPLTIADTEINRLVIERVRQVFPEHGVIGEEESWPVEGATHSWVVDPIDGTGPFVFGAPLSMFSLALVEHDHGQPVVAVTYDPFLDDLYSATAGGGTWVNQRQVRTDSAMRLESKFVSLLSGAGVPTGSACLNYGECRQHIWDQKAKIISLFAHVYPASRVASGELIAAVLGYGSPWDAAAVALLVTEAGGVASDMDGRARRYDEFGHGIVLSANPAIHEQVVTAIRDTSDAHPRD